MSDEKLMAEDNKVSCAATEKVEALLDMCGGVPMTYALARKVAEAAFAEGALYAARYAAHTIANPPENKS